MTGYHTLKESNGDHMPQELATMANLAWRVSFELSPRTFVLWYGELGRALVIPIVGIISAITQGGPATATETLVYKVYKDGVHNLDLGSSAAQSVVLMVIVVGLTLLQFRFVERRVHYG